MNDRAPAPAVVLVIEDDRAIRRFLRAGLEAEGFAVVEAVDGRGGVSEAAMRSPELVLLDLGLPDMEGLDVVKRLREWSNVPIVVLSARGRERDKIETLDAGADDYVTKPFAMGELMARIRVALRHRARGGDDGDTVVRVDGLEIDLGRRRVSVGGGDVRLTPIEYRLLTALARVQGRVVTHEQLLREVWGPAHVRQTHYLRVYMAQLRHKLEADPARPRFLLTEPGVGYRLRDA